MTALKVGIIPSENETQYCLNRAYIDWAFATFGLSWPTLIFDPSQVAGLDVLVLPGGTDIDPTLFGEDNYASYGVNTNMDQLWGKCVDEAISRKVPQIYGICKGHQFLAYKYLINAAYPRFEYVQNINSHNQGDLRIPRTSCTHGVLNLATHTLEYVNSMHHQALLLEKVAVKDPKYLGVMTHYTYFGAPDGTVVVEGIRFTIDKTLVTGVQWHPEEL